ncbi:T9SS type A sorting domain-containing protein, partial [Maribacter arcticus]|uniref:T9SS type A sorting domain-containing protein n=1 Tax=Maribacter arcticus TaxID=561365 RepID=UPI0030022571
PSFEIDQDNDGVSDSIDDCPNSPEGESVNDNGCSINTFPSNQFKITSIGTSCIGSNNGSILIESITNEDFAATITGPNNTITLPFTEILAIEDLDLGEYNLCISSIEFPNYQTCSKIIITEPLPLSVQLDFNSLTNSVTLKMNGAKEYTIEINGKSMEVKNHLISIPLYDEVNNVIVSTNQSCQGKFEETIILENSFLIYPNPVSESLTIDLKSLTSDTVEIAIFTEAGLLVHSETYLVKQSKIELNTSAFSSGIYFLRVKNDKVNKSFKLIKQ